MISNLHKSTLLLCAFFLLFIQSHAHPKLENLKIKKKSKTADIIFNITDQNQNPILDDCRIILQNEDLPEEEKTYETTIKSGSKINIPKGLWDLKVIYKFGFIPYQKTLIIKKNKKYQINITFKTWSPMQANNYLIGKIFDPNQKVEEGVQSTKTKSLERYDFFGTPFMGSFAPKNTAFLTDWLRHQKYWGNIWYASQEPFPIDTQKKESFQLLQECKKRESLSFYYRPGNSKLESTKLLGLGANQETIKHFKEASHYYPYMAASLILNTIAGPLYDGLDINIYDREDQKIWYCLLNLGYQIPAVSSSAQYNLNEDETWTFLNAPQNSTLQAKFKAIKAGQMVLSNAPSIIFKIGNKSPGESIIANGSTKSMHIHTNLNPSSWDRISKIEIIRNGKIIKNLALDEMKNEFRITFAHVFEREYAWYIVKVYTKDLKIAITNPIYFYPKNFKAPKPAKSLLKLNFINSDNQAIQNIRVTCYDGNTILQTKDLSKENKIDLNLPLKSSIEISHALYQTKTVTIPQLFNIDKKLNELMSFEKGGPQLLSNPEIYQKWRDQLLLLRKTITLQAK